MLGLVVSLWLLGAVSVARSQTRPTSTSVGPVMLPTSTSLDPVCASKPGFVPGSANCCGNFAFTDLFQPPICCSDTTTGKCYCDSTRFPECAASGSSPAMLCSREVTPTRRILGASAVKESCQGRGAVGLFVDDVAFCNAAYVKQADDGQQVLFTTNNCWTLFTMSLGAKVSGAIFGDFVPFDNCTITDAVQEENGLTKLTLSPLAAYFLESHVQDCPSAGCVYDNRAMGNAIDFTACFVVSHGFTSTPGLSLQNDGTGSRVMIAVTDITNCKDKLPGSQCFQYSGGARCLGDRGAPVYCSLTTGEVALYGLTSSPTSTCDPEDSFFSVIPIKG